MLEQIVRIQINDDKAKAEKFIEENFVWTKEIELVARSVRKVNKFLNGTVEAPLAEDLKTQDN